MTGGAEGVAQLSEILVFDKSLGGTAQDVVDLARSSLDQCDGVGMQLVDREGLGARVSTDERSSDLDALQDELDDGPCVECLRTGVLHDLEPVTSDERWPTFAPSARHAGLIACLALPLITEGELIGVLNLYAWPVGGFAGWDRQHCTDFALHASISLASAQAYARTQVLIAELQARLAAGDDLIDRAHGALMELGNTSLDDAVSRLSEMADARRCTLDVAAQSVLDAVAEGD
jgi:GAF domain-containing protein